MQNDLQSIGQLLENHAQRFADKQAIIAASVDSDKEQIISYKKLYKLVAQTASFLTNLGIKKGDRYAILMNNTPEVLLFELAGALIGATTVPLDSKRDTLERKVFKLKDTSSKALFIKLEEDNKQAELVEIEKIYPIKIFSWSDFAEFEKLLPVETTEDHYNQSLDTHYVVLYTSGTTAMPKGVLLSTKACLLNALGIVDWQRMDVNTRFNIVLPLHHINSTEFCLATLLAGGTIILNSRYSASKFWQIAAKYKATNTSIVPTILHDLLTRYDEFKAEKLDVTSFKRICIGSAPVLPEETLRFYKTFGIRVVQGYGQTETALRVAGVPVDLPEKDYQKMVKINTIGVHLANDEIAVMDQDNNEKKEGEHGEVCMSGPVLADGYLNNPEETAKAFKKGWFHSGDLGYFKIIDGKKYFFLIGRIKEIIIKGGVNLSPSAIEDSLLKNFPGIDEVAVVGIEDVRMGEEVGAAIVPKKGIDGQVLVKQIIEAGQEGKITGISAYEVPKKVFVFESLPKTSTGKIQRFETKKKVDKLLKEGQEEKRYFVRQILSTETEILKTATEINNERFAPLKAPLSEFASRAENGVLLGVFEEKLGLVGTLSCIRLKSQIAESLTSWEQATDGGTLQNNDPNGDALVCVAISVRLSKKGEQQNLQTNGIDKEKLAQLAKEKIEWYVNSDLDHVLNFHRQSKGGLPGAIVWKILEGGRDQDQSSMGYNVLMKYPGLENVKIIRSNTQRPSILLIEQALLYAKEKGIKEVIAFSRPSGFREYLISQLKNK
ncbi:acyl--CoA ligase [Candidatus Daviesbacteria bacterium]|nr:acyl--CoA ligase [Candidatus Daviesbacteria bacterium]